MTRERIAGFDGLRAIACLIVIGHHFRIPGLSGGWLGVDVFFVMSGFLITGILLKEHNRTGRVDLRRFYVRRAARLYPAILVLLALCIPAAILLDRGGWILTLENMFLSLTYLTDVADLMGIGGWAPLGHMWSLAVEEQFYLLWPLAFLATGRIQNRLRWIGLTVGTLSIVGGLLSTWSISTLPAGYYLPHARAWEILAGCLLALYPAARTSGTWAAWLGMLAIVTGIAVAPVISRDSAWQMMTCIAIAVAGTLLFLGSHEMPAFLSWRPLAEIGVRSYGAYLFHNPILHMLWIAGFSDPECVALGGAATALVTWASYRWVESPLKALPAAWDRRGPGRHVSSGQRQAPDVGLVTVSR